MLKFHIYSADVCRGVEILNAENTQINRSICNKFFLPTPIQLIRKTVSISPFELAKNKIAITLNCYLFNWKHEIFNVNEIFSHLLMIASVAERQNGKIAERKTNINHQLIYNEYLCVYAIHMAHYLLNKITIERLIFTVVPVDSHQRNTNRQQNRACTALHCTDTHTRAHQHNHCFVYIKTIYLKFFVQNHKIENV